MQIIKIKGSNSINVKNSVKPTPKIVPAITQAITADSSVKEI
jgi:hypothetical protein